MLNKIKWFWRYYKKHKYVLFILLLFTPIQMAFQVTIPRMIDFTVDYFDNGKVSSDWLAQSLSSIGGFFNLNPPVTFGLSFMGLGLCSAILYAFVQSHRAWMNLKLEWMFRQSAFDGITRKGPDFFNKFRTGDLVTRMTDDVAEKLSWFACSGIFRFYEALLQITFVVTMMIIIDPKLTLWAAGPLPILILIFFKTATLLDKRYDHLQSRISKFNDVLEACFYGIRVVKAYVREKAQKGKFETTALDRRQAEIDTVKVQTVIESMYFYIWQISIMIILVAGGYFIMNSDLSRGKLGTFLFYTVWLVFPMFDIGQFLVKSRQSAVSINRLQELENMSPMVTEQMVETKINSLEGDIIFEKVYFTFPELDYNIIDNISLTIGRGETVALVGKVGSGKSWLVNMLPRLVDPSGGRISINGTELSKFSLEDLRRNIGYVPQEPVLFSDTIRNNITMGREDISEATLNWAIELAQFKSEIDSFPKGLETFVGSRGMSISGGQKQRLGLARALAGKPQILILDDCTSALDSNTEAALWEGLHEVLPDVTALLITHRPDTLERADNIYVLENGAIIESGKHEELVAQETNYAKIYKRLQLEAMVKE